MKKSFSLLSLFLVICLYANDGTFTVSGNQLIPIEETDISVKKEILTINRSTKDPNQAEISVYYEFYNPGKAKTLMIGFEAEFPEGDVAFILTSHQQPYIHDFTVDINGQRLPYQVAIVSDSLYYKNGKLKALTDKQVEDWDGEGNFRYVYYFQAKFKNGLNIIKHTYTCDFSTSVMSLYGFDYILSAAMRWGNKQIDDFTLIINMGDEQRINIAKTFFSKADEWTIAGIGKKINMKTLYYEEGSGGMPEPPEPSVGFYIKKGYLIFQKQNFKPKGELSFVSPYFRFSCDFNYKEQPFIGRYPFHDDIDYERKPPILDSVSIKILRNLPFASRGYIFSTPELQKYFEKQIWYFPDPDYKPNMTELTADEQKWIEYWSKYITGK